LKFRNETKEETRKEWDGEIERERESESERARGRGREGERERIKTTILTSVHILYCVIQFFIDHDTIVQRNVVTATITTTQSRACEDLNHSVWI
jgi:hypothetical protein